MIPNRGTTSRQKWRTHVQICPITSGLETKMTRNGFAILCEKYRLQSKAKDVQDSCDPHAKWCKKCKGQILPEELEFIEIN